jgi:site-specific recombinase XerD
MKKITNSARHRQKHATDPRHTSASRLRNTSGASHRLDPFPTLMHGFFHECLTESRNASIHTIRSYRDTWRLFLRFVGTRKRKEIAEIKLADLTAIEVSAFLGHTEHDRKGTIGTRNCRLAAIRSFFHFVAGKEPTAIAQCTEVIAIPIKRAPIPAPCYLEPREVEAILAEPDRSTLEGLRDHALLSFLYNSGARIQEALDLTPEAIRFETPNCVRLYGKGRKERICPLWPETVLLLKKLLERQPRGPSERIFINRYGEPLGASGVRFKLAAYVEAAAKTVPTLRSKTVTPHSFRHATAVHLVSAGVDVTVIRSWLGHVSLDTTNHYARANLETKRKALERVGAPAPGKKLPSWKRDTSVLAWLDSL